MITSKKVYENSNINDLFYHVEIKAKESEKLKVEHYSYWRSVFREFFKKPQAIFAIIGIVITLFFAFLIPILSPYNPMVLLSQSDLIEYSKPSFSNWFGVDNSQRDIFTRVWFGARVSLLLAFVVSTINVSVGVFVGVVWGYYRKLDPVMIEIYNFVANVPSILYMILISYILGPSFGTLVFVLVLTGWLGMARFVRNQILIYNNREFNIASRTLGTPAGRVITHNLLPYIFTVIITTTSLMIPAVISAEVGLTYLKLGLPIEQLSLGQVLNQTYAMAWETYPFVILFPAGVIGFITVCFYLLGLTLSDAMDPRNHR